MSTVLPAVNGMIARIDFDGHDCARAMRGSARAVSPAPSWARWRRRVWRMVFPFSNSVAQPGSRHNAAKGLRWQPTLRRPLVVARGLAPCLFSLPANVRGAERRQALVRKRRTRWSVSRADRSPDRRRSPAMTRTGAPFGALLRLSPPPLGDDSAPGRACVSRCHPGRQRAPRTGTVASQGGSRSRPSVEVTRPDPQAPHKRTTSSAPGPLA